MGNPKDKKTWKSLRQIREEIPSGHWAHNRIFEDISASIELGVRPSEFASWADQDKAFVLAQLRVKSTISSYESYLGEKAAQRSAAARSRK